MSILKYLNRIKRMDDLIRRKATGTPEQFAEKLGLSRSTLMEYLRFLKELDAPVKYDHHRGSYRYQFPCKLKIGFEDMTLKINELEKINSQELKRICSHIESGNEGASRY